MLPEMCPNLNYKFNNQNGVIHVYAENSNDTHFEWISYPDLSTFIEEYRILVTLISHGPL